MSAKFFRVRIKHTIQRAFRKRGYQIVRIEHCPHVMDHPVDAYYASYRRRYVAFWCDLELCVTYNGLEYGRRGSHPFVKVLDHYREGHVRDYAGSALEDYYENWTPRNASEAITGNPNVPEALVGHPVYTRLLPWDPLSIGERKQKEKDMIEGENRREGLRDVYVENGLKLFGPVSKKKGEVEFTRLVKVYKSIRDRGYLRDKYGDITGTILRNGEQYRCLVGHGHHRLAALTVLGYNSVPIQIKNRVMVNRDDVLHWPQVRRGVWKREDALAYFDKLFERAVQVKL